MSFVITTDVFCDGPSCSQWTHGVTGGPPVWAKKQACEAAACEGWLIVKGKHYCPACKARLFPRTP